MVVVVVVVVVVAVAVVTSFHLSHLSEGGRRLGVYGHTGIRNDCTILYVVRILGRPTDHLLLRPTILHNLHPLNLFLFVSQNPFPFHSDLKALEQTALGAKATSYPIDDAMILKQTLQAHLFEGVAPEESLARFAGNCIEVASYGFVAANCTILLRPIPTLQSSST